MYLGLMAIRALPTGSFNEALVLPSINGEERYDTLKYLSRNISLVRCRENGMLLAAKQIELDATGDDELRHVQTGIRVTVELRHRNVCPVLTSYVKLNVLWILSPHYELGSASDLCKPYGIDDELCLAYILRDVLTALEYIHQRGYIHRAVRASHILVRDNGVCVLSGFKYCASVIKDGKWQTVIHEYPNNAKPNLNWLSPEVLEQNLLGYDSKSDIYSLGITCCELANGQIPFSYLSATEMLLDKLTGHMPSPLDSTCTYLIPLPDGMTDEDREKVQAYESRRFSDLFHAFTSELCLNCDHTKRPTASQLLNHRFIKQLKKASPAVCVFSELARRQSQRSSSSSNSEIRDGGGGSSSSSRDDAIVSGNQEEHDNISWDLS